MSINADKLIKHYIYLRDQKEEMEARHKEELRPIKDDMQQVEAALQKLMQEQGLRQFKGDHGTAFIQEDTSAKVTDWNEALDYIRNNERWDLLEKRVNKTQLMETLEEEGPVPGVDVNRRMKTLVRRS